MALRRFVVLDRDGTIIRHRDYLTDPDYVELIPGVAEGLRKLRAMGLGLVILTNQSAVGRGMLDEARLEAIHERLLQLLAAEGVAIDAIYVCPHLPEDACACRKPELGLLKQAAWELGFDPEESFVVGDNTCDVGLGRGAGATTFLVRSRYGAPEGAECPIPADYSVTSFGEAVGLIRQLMIEFEQR